MSCENRDVPKMEKTLFISQDKTDFQNVILNSFTWWFGGFLERNGRIIN